MAEAGGLRPFVDSTELLADDDALRDRFALDGYVLLRGVVDGRVLLGVRDRITAICRRHGWLRPGTIPHDAVTAVKPRVEGEERYFEVYDEIQRLEAFHAVPHHESVRRCVTALLGPTAFPHPLSIARLSFPDNERWTTPPHQDWPNNQGTEDLVACWMPLGDCPVELGGLSLLRGSNRLGVLPLAYALGAGHRRAVLDDRHRALAWVGGDLRSGDALLFHSLTVHRALPNRTNRLRLSVDYRFQRQGEPLTAECLEPHFSRLTWDEIYEGWSRADLRYYWRNMRYEVVPWDPSWHELPQDSSREAYRTWLAWAQDRAERWSVRHG